MPLMKFIGHKHHAEGDKCTVHVHLKEGADHDGVYHTIHIS